MHQRFESARRLLVFSPFSPGLKLSPTLAHSMNPNNSGELDLSEHPLVVAMATGDMECFRMLIAKGADLNTPVM